MYTTDIMIMESSIGEIEFEIYANVTEEFFVYSGADGFRTKQVDYNWNLNYIFADIDGERVKLENLPKVVCAKFFDIVDEQLPSESFLQKCDDDDGERRWEEQHERLEFESSCDDSGTIAALLNKQQGEMR